MLLGTHARTVEQYFLLPAFMLTVFFIFTSWLPLKLVYSTPTAIASAPIFSISSSAEVTVRHTEGTVKN